MKTNPFKHLYIIHIYVIHDLLTICSPKFPQSKGTYFIGMLKFEQKKTQVNIVCGNEVLDLLVDTRTTIRLLYILLVQLVVSSY